MIDFKEYTNIGLRNISYNGVNSLSDLGIVITTEGTNVGELEVKSDTESLPRMQGNIDFSRTDGTLYYEARRLVYRFKLVADSIEDLKAMEKDVYEWLNSSGNYTIQDSNYDGYEFRKCELKGMTTEQGETLMHGEYSYITAVFECYPLLFKIGSVNEYILRFALRGNFVLVDFNNSSLTVMQNGSTVIGPISYTAAEPYTYRLVCITENTPTITLNGAEILPDELFEMPNGNAPIYVSHTGYGWYELWHDTREVIP